MRQVRAVHRHEAVAATDNVGAFSRAWAVGTAELAVKSFAASLLSLIGAGSLNVLHVAWGTALGTAAGAALLSVLGSVISAPVGQKGTNFISQGQ